MNGEELSRTSAAEQHWSWDELAAHAARDTTLEPGDVLGSGTLNGGCLLELGPIEGERWLEPGDEVVIAADGLGELAAAIVVRTYSTGRSKSVDRTTCVWVRVMPGRVAKALERLFEVLGVPRVQVEDRARLAGDRVGGGDLGVPPGGGEDLRGGHPALAEERDDGVGGPAERDVVEHGRVALDDAGLLEPVDPALDRGRAERDARADVLEGAAGVLTQERNDLLVDFVEIHAGSALQRNESALK